MNTRLGFGCLRLPLKDPRDITSINSAEFSRLADMFIENGFGYFDTAYTYHSCFSEAAVREAVVKRHKRDEFQLATKMPMHLFQSHAGLEEIFSAQQKNCGTDFFDRYLLHSLNAGAYAKAEEFDAFGFAAEKKQDGHIGKFGISYHDSPELLDKVLTEHPEIDFVLLQINYIDWENPGVQSRMCYETARRHHKPVLVMEPVKGGNLAAVPQDAEKLMRDYNPNTSPASWALRFAAGLEGVETVLSGMNTAEQVRENMQTFANPAPLNTKELEILRKVTDSINAHPQIPCTACRYCEAGCPQNIAIAEYFALYNSAKQDNAQTAGAASSQFFYYLNLTASRGKASDCIDCGQCMEICPQHIPVPERIADVAEMFEQCPSYPTKR